MKTAFWAPYISDATIKAICWTLIHSLWIGMIVALLAGVIISLTRKSAAALRYRLLCTVLVLFILSIGVTYYVEADSNPTMPVVAGAAKVFISTTAASPSPYIAAAQNQNIIGRLADFLNQNISAIFLVWLLFFVLKSLKMMSGLLYIQRIRNYKTYPITEELKHKIERFSTQMGIRRVVCLVQSELVKVPVAIGWLKPMILLPLGIALQLTPEQLDGILWHELAHIYRRDYLVNILQGLLETVFFFNPGLLWLSSLIRAEREACCDDMVLSRMNRKANYLEALLSFGYGEFSQARYAMSIGSGNQLRERLKRMISQENKRLSVAEKAVLAVGLICLTAFTTISKNSPIIKHLTVKYTNKSGRVATKAMTISMHHLPRGQRVSDSKPGSRAKDTIVIADTAIHFTSVLFKNSDADLANNDISAMDDKGNEYHFTVAGNQLVAMEMNGGKIADDKLAGFDYMIRYIDRELAVKRRVRSQDIAAMKANSPGVKFKNQDGIRFKKQSYTDRQDSVESKHKAMLAERMKANPADGEPVLKKIKALSQRRTEDSISYAKQLQRAQHVIADLTYAKVVPNAKAVTWFGLTDTELIVNGQKQSNELQQKLAGRYGIHKDYGLFYGPVKMTGTGVFIDVTGPDKDHSLRNDRPERPQPSVPAPSLDKMISDVTNDLINEHILRDKSGLSTFKLTNTELVVNGVKQSADIQKKLCVKYYPGNSKLSNDPNYGLYYNAKTHGVALGTFDLDLDAL